jgi:hypothetical protein
MGVMMVRILKRSASFSGQEISAVNSIGPGKWELKKCHDGFLILLELEKAYF